MCSILPPKLMSILPLPPSSRRFRIASSTCMFQAKSYSPVCSTARAADPASQIGRAHVCTPVPNAQLVCRLLLEKKKTPNTKTPKSQACKQNIPSQNTQVSNQNFTANMTLTHDSNT